MTRRLFQNRWQRIYFQLLDAFARPRCPLCALISELDRTLIASFFASSDKRKKIKTALKVLCAAHKTRLKEIGADDPAFLIMLKTAMRDSLGALAHRHGHSTSRWRRWFGPFRASCPLCTQLSSEERVLCRALIRFLDDTEFWKGFQGASLLCLDHLEKCLAVAEQSVGFKRLLDDQSAKLNELLDDLIRFEATGTHGECKSTALDWLADFAGTTLDPGNADGSFTEPDLPPELTSPLADESQNQEQLLFQKEKLTRKVRDLLDRLNDVETRAASLGYQVAKLSEDNKRLEMGYTGANTQANGLNQLVQDLRKEIHQLKNGGAEPSAKAVS